MGQWSEHLRAERTGRTATDRAGARPDRSRRLVVEALESRRLLSIGIREFPIPTANSGASWITTGPDGNLYFTAGIVNQIASIQPGDARFSPCIRSRRQQWANQLIATGPDGNL